MKRRIALIGSLIAGGALVFTAQAAPPESKGSSHSAGHSGKGGNGNSNRGEPGKSNPGKGSSDIKGNGPTMHGSPGNDNGAKRNQSQGATHAGNDDNGHEGRRTYDDRGRYYDYFDDHRDYQGRHRDGDAFGDLVYAGITAALAREYALDYGLGGYSSLPPGIRKNLARGKPLPPGIAKKMVPGSLLGRLPRYPGYEWRIVGSDLILISVTTAVIADILYDVFD